MKVLVTGREGQLARSLAERGRGQGLALIFAGRPEVDFERMGELGAANAAAAGEAAAAAAGIGARFVQLSTDYVFPGVTAGAYREDEPTGPLSVYGKSKLAGEQTVRHADPASVIVRTAWVYSPFGKNFMRSIMAAAAAGKDPLRVVADQYGSPTSALCLADGLLALVARWSEGDNVGQGQTYHLAGEGQASWFEFAEYVMQRCRAAGLQASGVEPITTTDWPTRAPRPANSLLDSSRFRSEIGYGCPPWRESVMEVLQTLNSPACGVA